MLNALPAEATVYVQNKNELNKWVGVTNNLRSLAANVEFTEDSVFDSNEIVNRQFSLSGTTVNKKDVAKDLRAILSRGGDPKELQRYVDRLERNSTGAEQNGENRYQKRLRGPAVSGSQKKSQTVGHEVPGNYPPSVASKISIQKDVDTVNLFLIMQAQC